MDSVFALLYDFNSYLLLNIIENSRLSSLVKTDFDNAQHLQQECAFVILLLVRILHTQKNSIIVIIHIGKRTFYTNMHLSLVTTPLATWNSGDFDFPPANPC